MNQAIKLNTAALSTSLPAVAVPTYDRQQIKSSIVHVGVGGFHRSHQAVYIDDLCQHHGETEWGFCGVGLLSRDRGPAESL